MSRPSAISSSPPAAGEPPASATPEALIAQAAEGNPQALIQLYDRFAPRLLGLVRRILSDTEESERVLEDIFSQLWREARQLARAKVSLAAWLTLAARTRALSRLRRRAGPADDGSNTAAEAEILVWLPAPAAMVRLDQRRVLLQKVLGQLPPPQTQALEMVMFEGRTEAELADHLDEPLARMKSELRAATRFLKHRRRAVVGSWTVAI